MKTFHDESNLSEFLVCENEQIDVPGKVDEINFEPLASGKLSQSYSNLFGGIDYE